MINQKENKKRGSLGLAKEGCWWEPLPPPWGWGDLRLEKHKAMQLAAGLPSFSPSGPHQPRREGAFPGKRLPAGNPPLGVTFVSKKCPGGGGRDTGGGYGASAPLQYVTISCRSASSRSRRKDPAGPPTRSLRGLRSGQHPLTTVPPPRTPKSRYNLLLICSHNNNNNNNDRHNFHNHKNQFFFQNLNNLSFCNGAKYLPPSLRR